MRLPLKRGGARRTVCICKSMRGVANCTAHSVGAAERHSCNDAVESRRMFALDVSAVVSQYFWLLGIAVTCANGLIWWRRALAQIALNPDREAGYRRLIIGSVIGGGIPWIVMGFGIVFGGVRDAFMYFSVRNGPYVIAWYITIVVLWVLSAVWLFFMRGVEQLIEHPGLMNLPSENPRMVKAFFLVCYAVSIIGLSVMIMGETATIP